MKQFCIQCPDALCTLCVKSALYVLRILMPLADYRCMDFGLRKKTGLAQATLCHTQLYIL